MPRNRSLARRMLSIGTLTLAAFLALPFAPALAVPAPIVTAPPSPSNDTTPTWTFHIPSSGSFTTDCRTMSGTTVVVDWAPCDAAVGYTPDLTGRPDGTYTADVRASSNGTSSVTTSDYVLDTTPPVAPTITSTPKSPSNSRTPGWAWTLPEGTGECQLVLGGTVVSPWTACTSPKSYDLTGAADGSYTFQVHAIDTAGNVGPAATNDYVLDTTPPAAPTVTVLTGSPGNKTTVQFSFVGEAGAQASCRLTSGGTALTSFTACTSPDTVDLSGNPDGTYTLQVFLTDAAGNAGTNGSADYVLDRQAPAAPTITSGPASLGNNATPAWSFTDEPGATFECRIDGPSGTGTYTSCTSPFTASLTQGDGGYTFNVRATDLAGNTGSAASAAYTLDTTPPPAPSLTGPTGPSSKANPSFTFTAEAGSTTQCRLDPPASTGSWSSCTSPYTPSLAAGDGTYAIQVRATDAAGNVGPAASASYLLDTQPPAAPDVTGPSGPSSSTSVTWTFTAESGASTECRLTGPGGTGSWAACTSPATRILTQGDGTYTLEVRATDAAGNVGPAGSASYLLDTTGPGAPTVTAPSSPATDTSPVFTFTAEAGSTTECRQVGPSATSAWAACASPVTVPANQGDGTYTLEVRATDAAGNLGAVGSAAYVLDTTAPAAPVVSGPASPGNGTTVAFSFTAESGATTECRLDGPAGIGTFSACTSPVTVSLSQGDGTYIFAVRATDAAGNTGSSGSASYVLDTVAPGAPSITAPAATGNDSNPTFTFTTPAGTAVLQCRLDGPGGTGSWATCSSPLTVTLTQGEGTYTLLVRAVDAAGNVGVPGSASYLLDITPPAAPLVSGPTGPSNSLSVTWTFTAEPGAATECRLVGPSATSAWAACTSPVTGIANQGDGSYTLQVRATDVAGNTGPAGSSPAYLLDTTAPAAPTVSGPASPGNQTTISFTFTAEAGATTQCRLDGPAGIGTFAACTSPVTVSLSQGDGTYVMRVRAIDQAGNTGAAGTATYLLDTTPPSSPTLSSSTPSPSNNTAPSWSFTLPSTTTASCEITRGGVVVSVWTECSSPYTANLSGLPDGTYTILIAAVDPAGNASTPVTVVYVLDTTAPASPVITPPSGTTSNDTTPSWSFTVEAGASTQCQVVRGTTVVLARSACSSPLTVDLVGYGDGTYTITVWATDAAGNTSAPGTATYLLDTVPPAAPTITGGPASPSSVRTPTWTFTTEPGATTLCRLTRDGTTPGAWATCASPYIGDLSTATDGTYDFEVRAIDAAGNQGPSATATYTLDTTAPAAPTLVSSTGSPSKSRTPSWSFTAEAGAALSCQLSGPKGIIDGWSPCSSPYTADLTGAPDGTYTFAVRATDAAGNVGAALMVDYQLDSTAPAAPTILSAPSGPSADRTPTWTFSGEPGAAFTCSITRGLTTVLAATSCTSPFTGQLSGQPDGTYTLTVVATDRSGNTSAGSTAQYILDTTPPPAPIFTAIPDSPSQQTMPSWSWALVSGTSSNCRLMRGSTLIVDWQACSSPFTADLTGLADGTYTLTVRLADAAGNLGPGASSSYVLDTTAPAAPVFTSTPTSPASSTHPTWTWSEPSGVTASCLVTGSGSVIRDWSPCSSPYGVNLSGVPDGTYQVSVRYTDAAGNTSPATTSSYRLDSTAPASSPPPSSSGDGGSAPPSSGPPHSAPGSSSRPVLRLRLPGSLGAPLSHGSLATGLKPSGQPPDQASSRGLFSPLLPPVGEVPNVIGQVAVKALEKPQFPLLLLVIVALFLLIQNRIDRKDPKLASAPVSSEPLLGFGPAVDVP